MGFPWFTNPKRNASEMEIIREEESSPNNVCGSNPRSVLPSRAELEEVFNIFDVNGDGKISWSEVGEVMRWLGSSATEEELRLMVKEGDINGDGFLDFSEFVELNTKDIDRESSLRDLEKAFHIFDVDGNGYISPHELQSVFMNLGDDCSLDECHGMIGRFDRDGDGSINFQEFLIMMTASA